MDKTQSIFELSCPYDNPYQGPQKRLLFVCSAGMMRSATGATVGAQFGFNTRSCGTEEHALVPLSINLISWAHIIYFVNIDNYAAALYYFENEEEALTLLRKKTRVLSIEDSYDYMDPKLVQIFEREISLLKREY